MIPFMESRFVVIKKLTALKNHFHLLKLNNPKWVKILLVVMTLFYFAPIYAEAKTSTTKVAHISKANKKTKHIIHKKHHQKITHTKHAHQDTQESSNDTQDRDLERSSLTKNLTTPNLAVPAYFYKNKEPDGTPPSKPSLSSFLMPAPEPSTSHRLVTAVEQHLVSFVHNTVATLRYSDYKLGGKKFDLEKGVYVVDCSNFVDHILQHVSPHAYTSLVNTTGSPSPASQQYYDFFSELTADSDHYWNKVTEVNSLRPGDILVFRYKNPHGSGTEGHVMVVMDKPIQDTNVFYVKVADSAPARHSQDTRNLNEAGIGIGTLLLKVNPETGKPSAYAWGIGSYWKKNVKFAMARPLDVV